jgi:hypothetical protein
MRNRLRGSSIICNFLHEDERTERLNTAESIGSKTFTKVEVEVQRIAWFLPKRSLR